MRVDQKPVNQCCGCMNCADVCPVAAISKGIDADGFTVPEIDDEKCIDCGRCVDACAFCHEDTPSYTVLRAYSFKLNNAEALSQSSSGGAFTALSDRVLDENGVIFGSIMDEKLTVRHASAQTASERDGMRLSKYVQSDTGGIFAQVKDFLDKGRTVLFVGAPCQTSQLNRYLGDRSGLVTCDFICHGVPSQELFFAHIASLEKRYKKKASYYTFRSKRYGWNHGIDEVYFTDGSRKDTMAVQSFTRLFQGNVSLRDSCAACPYAGERHNADITIADFWGYEKLSGQNDLKGVSLVLANTEKGASFVSEISAYGSLQEIPLEKIRDRLAVAPFKSIFDVDTFRSAVSKEGYDNAVARALSNSLKKCIKFSVKKKVLKIKSRN